MRMLHALMLWKQDIVTTCTACSLQCPNAALGAIFETVIPNRRIADFFHGIEKRLCRLAFDLRLSSKIKIHFNAAAVLFVIHSINLALCLYELHFVVPAVKAGAHVKQEYLMRKWRTERDVSNAWYVVAVFLAIRIISTLMDKIDTVQEENDSLKKKE